MLPEHEISFFYAALAQLAPDMRPVFAERVARLNCSPSLDHLAGIFPAFPDQGGPTAADLWTSAIGVLLPIAL